MAKAIDPVCGMTVDTETAPAKAEYESKTYYFCTEACADTFRADPERFIGDELEQHERPFTTKGKMTAPKFGSAGSGGAEYERPPERHKQ